jgi:hypothetical protein
MEIPNLKRRNEVFFQEGKRSEHEQAVFNDKELILHRKMWNGEQIKK